MIRPPAGTRSPRPRHSQTHTGTQIKLDSGDIQTPSEPSNSMRFRFRPTDLFFETQTPTVQDFVEFGQPQHHSPEPPVDIIKALIEGAEIPETDPDTLAHAVVALEEQRNQAMVHCSALKAQQFQTAVDRARFLQFEALKKQRQTTRLSEVQKRRTTTDNLFQNFKDGIRIREQQLDCRLSDYIDSTKNRHFQELEELTRCWQSDSVRRRYNRPSVELKDLRKQEELLIKANRFIDADEIGRLADEREKQETEAAYHQMLYDYQVLRRRIEARHNLELSMACEVARMKKEEFVYFTDKVTTPWSARFKKLDFEEESSRDPQKFWNRTGRFDPHPIEQFVGMRPGTRSLKVRRADDGTALKLPPLPFLSTSQAYDG